MLESKQARHYSDRIEVDDLDKLNSTEQGARMDVRKLKRILVRLRDSYSAVGASRPAKDVSAVAGLLRGHEDRSVEAFVGETEVLLSNATSAVVNRREPSNNVVAKHVHRLLSVGADRSAFDEAMIALE